jgi:hypothetical protein
MSLYLDSVVQFSKVLTNIESWLDKAEAYAKQKSFDPNILLQARLAPDQFSLLKQLQIVSDWAKNGASRLAGKDAPAFPDDEHTFEQIRKRVKSTIAYLATFSEQDFNGAEKRVVPIARIPGKGQLAPIYLRETIQPNFYFHATTAYAILRHNGVDLGKRDYVGAPTTQDL